MLYYQLVFAILPVEGTWFSSQLDGLGDGRESVCDSLNFDCSFFAVHAWPGQSRKIFTDDIVLDGTIYIGEEMINFADIGVVTPIIPVCLSIFGSICNQAICNCFHSDMQSLAIPIRWKCGTRAKTYSVEEVSDD